MTLNENPRSETETESQQDGHERTIEAQRTAVVDEIEGLLNIVEARTGRRIGRVRQNIHLARADLLDDGEFNYCVRLALIQLDYDAEKLDDTTALREHLNILMDQLPEKAALPPEDQISR